VASLSPLPCWGGEENQKKKAKLVGQDKDSLTEQQKKQTVTNIILIRTREYTEQLFHRPMPSALLSCD